MGITVPLHYTRSFHYRATFENGLIEDEVDHVFVGESVTQLQPSPHPEEVIETRWVQLNKLIALMQRYPTQFTPWCAAALEVALEKKCP